MKPFTRREFLNRSLAIGVFAGRPISPFRDGQTSPNHFFGTIPLSRPNATPLNRLLGAGLDARLFSDLSTLTSDSLITPNERFYVRTACPDVARVVEDWTIRIAGLIRAPLEISASELTRGSEELGACLLECSGNSDPNNFGLMSAARWRGIRIGSVLRRVELLPRATHVRISGLDHARSALGTSTPGASWIFVLDQVAEAFLATGMNGSPLPADHGAPVRLVVPGSYGCTCIKWVNSIELVDDRVPPTGQMVEFAARTHQRGVPSLASDFAPATIDHAAFPVRVEHWSIDGRSVYRVIGIQWGGDRPSNALEIRFRSDLPFVRVTDCPLPAATRTWSLWTHDWIPDAPGRYDISLRMADHTMRTRRLDLNFYRRALTIESV